MIHTSKTSHGLPYSAVWFPDEHDLEAVLALRSVVTVVRQGSAAFVRAYAPRIAHQRRFCTAVLDLSKCEDELQGGLSRNRRAQLRKAGQHTYEIRRGPPSTLAAGRLLIDTFLGTSLGQAVGQANWRLIERHGWLAQAEQGGRVVAAVALLADAPRRARMMYAATAPRQDASFPGSLIGDLNSALIWNEVHHCRAEGYQLFDFGGLFDDPAHPSSGVDTFKLSFGAEKTYEYHALSSRFHLTRRALATLGRSV